MNSDEYLLNLQERFERYFDISRNINILDREINLFAKYKNINNKTFITKNDVVDSYENNEYCFVKRFENPSFMEISEFMDFLKSASREFVKPDRNHMSSYVTGIMVVDGSISNEIESLVRKFKYSKVFAFYLKGWCDIRLVLVKPENGSVITNKAASSVKKVYKVTS